MKGAPSPFPKELMETVQGYIHAQGYYMMCRAQLRQLSPPATQGRALQAQQILAFAEACGVDVEVSADLGVARFVSRPPAASVC